MFSWRGLGDRDRAVSRKHIFGQVSLSQEGNSRRLVSSRQIQVHDELLHSPPYVHVLVLLCALPRCVRAIATHARTHIRTDVHIVGRSNMAQRGRGC